MDTRQEQYISGYAEKLRSLQMMWKDPRVQLYDDAALPDLSDGGDSIFLAGPTSRNQVLECNWRCTAVHHLRSFGFTGWIFCPEPRGLGNRGDFTERSHIYKWESTRLMNAKRAVFWIPRKAGELLGLNTNLELGIFLGRTIGNQLNGQKLHVGWPSTAERMGLPEHYTKMAGVKHYDNMNQLCMDIAADKIK